MRLPVNHALPLAALAMLGGCIGGGERPAASVPLAANGPSADYPMVLGPTYTIGDTQYTPVDRMNSDEVGHAAIGEAGAGVSAAHKTLPLPSYAEVTALDTGRTILVRVERRGPMRNDQLIELSPAAAAQLGMAGTGKTPVRVRRVNPPEAERALLRSGQTAPRRMDTPSPLLAVLMRKLYPATPVALPPAPVAAASVAATVPPPPPKPRVAPAPPKPAVTPVVAVPAPAPRAPTQAATPPAVSTGVLIVQAAAFSQRARAEAAARAIGGQVTAAGPLFRVRVGPFPTQALANVALAKVKGAGYPDARVQRAD